MIKEEATQGVKILCRSERGTYHSQLAPVHEKMGEYPRQQLVLIYCN